MSFTVCHSKAWKLICIYFEYAKVRRIKKNCKEARTRHRWRRHNEITRKKVFPSLIFTPLLWKMNHHHHLFHFISLHSETKSLLFWSLLSLSLSLVMPTRCFLSFFWVSSSSLPPPSSTSLLCYAKKERDYERRKKVYDPTITVNKLCLCVPGIHLEKERRKIRRIRQKRWGKNFLVLNSYFPFIALSHFHIHNFFSHKKRERKNKNIAK